ncbi:MAG: ABC transporter permease subunit, partial [Clostridia bacterium]
VPQIDEKVVDIVMTKQVALALTESGKLYSWGESTSEEIALPANATNVKSISSGIKHFSAVTKDGQIISWGNNKYNQAKAPKGDYIAIFSGSNQNYAITKDGDIKTFGLKGYLMGTDFYGRDVFSRLLTGGRMTMTIGAISVIIATIIGVIIGGLSGYYGGKIDMVLMRIAEVVGSLPFLPFAMILSVFIGNSISETARIALIMVILGVLSWPGLARLVRAQILAEREKEFVTAAKAVGIKEWSIIFKHIMPNVIAVIIVSTTLSFASSMLTESSLSFLGFGVVEPGATWGNMLTGSQSSTVLIDYWWRWLFPAIALSISTISINVIGDGLQAAIDPKSNDR